MGRLTLPPCFVLLTCPQQHEEGHDEPQQGSEHYGSAVPCEAPPADQAASPGNQDGQTKENCKERSGGHAAVGTRSQQDPSNAAAPARYHPPAMGMKRQVSCILMVGD